MSLIGKGEIDKALGNKAVVIGKRHNKECVLCFMLDTEENKKEGKKFFCYDEGWYTREPKYICSDCRDGLKEVRKLCHTKISNPALDIFTNFQPWCSKVIPFMNQAKK